VRTHVGVLVVALSAARFANGQATASAPAPIDLPAALRLAGAQNLDVQLAQAALTQERARSTSAMEQLVPWISPGVSYRRRDGLAQASPSGIVGKAAYWSYAPGGSVVAQVAYGDAIYGALASRRSVDASSADLETQRDVAAVRAAQAYFDLAKAKAQVDVVRQAIATSAEYQSQLHEAVAAGIAFRGDELRVQTQTDHYQVVLRDALAQQRIASVALATVLHLDAQRDLVSSDSDLVPIMLVDTTAAVDTLVARAIRRRPEIQQWEARTTVSETLRRGAVYGPLVPALGLQIFAGGLSGGPDSGRTRSGGMSDYSIGVSWRVGPGGLFDRARVSTADAQLAAARVGLAKERDIVAAEVVSGLARTRALGAQIALARRALESARLTLQLTRGRKEFGVGSVLEDIQAQQALTQAGGDYVNAVAEFDKAEYSLGKAVGMGATVLGAPR
jgi:outer membrane protein TolC